MKRRYSSICALAVALAAVISSLGMACSVPVFRYALEQWAPDNYRLYVFHRGPLSQRELSLLAALDSTSDATISSNANLVIKAVDLEREPDGELAALWTVHAGPEPLDKPQLVLVPPARHGAAIVWSGALEEEAPEALLDSPARRGIAQRLLQGGSVVWVMLEGGNAEADDRAFRTLENQLDALENSLTLPQLAAEDATTFAIDQDSLRLSFSALRVARDDPDERVLVDLLLGVEPDLRDEEFADQPMVFPIFGRGRALYALVGDGITPSLIEDAARFLTGACQCTVKAQNPGVDLLLSVDWDQHVTPLMEQDQELPPLAGLEGFVADASNGDGEDKAAFGKRGRERSFDDQSAATGRTDRVWQSASRSAADETAVATTRTGREARENAPSARQSPVATIVVLVLGTLLAVGLVVGLAGLLLVRREA